MSKHSFAGWRRALLGGVALVASLGAAARAGTPLPPMTLTTPDESPLRLAALKGKVVVLDIWAPWCAPCRASFPFYDALGQRYAARGVAVVGLTFDRDDEAIRAFLAGAPVHFAIALDRTGQAGTALGVEAMPTTFVLDRDGTIAARFEGGSALVHERVDRAVQLLLDGKPLPANFDVRVGDGLRARGAVKAWDRGRLADPMMNLDGDPLTRVLREHIHASKEGAAGDGGAAGGGCGCN